MLNIFLLIDTNVLDSLGEKGKLGTSRKCRYMEGEPILTIAEDQPCDTFTLCFLQAHRTNPSPDARLNVWKCLVVTFGTKFTESKPGVSVTILKVNAI